MKYMSKVAGHTRNRFRLCRLARLVPVCMFAIVGTDAYAAAPYCAHTSAELIADLADVSTDGVANGHENTIRLVAGTFTTSGASFAFKSASGFALTLAGGYDSGCTTQDSTPGVTKLDGAGINQVLSIQTNGMITVSHLTIQHGFRDGSANGGGVGIILTHVQPADPVPVAIISDNVVRDNVSNYSVGGLSVFASAPMPDTPVGIVDIENNLFVGNTAPTSAAFSTSCESGTVYITNNTITGNSNTTNDHMIAVIGGAGSVAYVSNTISYGNLGTGTYDFYIPGFQNVQFNNNDYGSIQGSAPAPGSSGNLIGIDPRFVAADDFHLRSTSPLLRAGTPTPAGGLPVLDIEGHPRSVGGRVDLGAFENVDFIFANGFDPN